MRHSWWSNIIHRTLSMLLCVDLIRVFYESFLFLKILREDKEAKNNTITQETAAAFLFVQWKKKPHHHFITRKKKRKKIGQLEMFKKKNNNDMNVYMSINLFSISFQLTPWTPNPPRKKRRCIKQIISKKTTIQIYIR